MAVEVQPNLHVEQRSDQNSDSIGVEFFFDARSTHSLYGGLMNPAAPGPK